METFVAIFTQLGVDSSLPYQFVILVLVFIVSNFLFLGKLQSILETREEKTVKLENSADGIIDNVNQMQTEYKTKIDEANRVAFKSATDKKQAINSKYTEQYKAAEKEVNAHIDQKRTEIAKDINSNKDKFLAESESLSQSLVQKILQ
jgi:F0F1-type ATP synthase membrane subunit b/b'